MFEVTLWFLLVQLISIMALPLSFSIFRFLPDHGYTLSKPLSLLLVAYPIWLLSATVLPFNAFYCWAIFFVVSLSLNGWLLWRAKGKLRSDLIKFFVSHSRFIVLCEIIFLLAYVYAIGIRLYTPDIADHEKFTDFSFIQSLYLSEKVPSADLWLSGYKINYYYFSHFMMAMLIKMTNIAPAIAFNLCLPIIFAMTALGSFGLVYNLITIAAKSAKSIVAKSPILFGLFGVGLMCFSGNLSPIKQIVLRIQGTAKTWGLDWWISGRIIEYNINEFPQFSFLLGDVHAHVMALPFTILAIGMALCLLCSPVDINLLGLQQNAGRLFFVITSLVFAGLYFLSSWDYPTYLALFLIVALLRVRRINRLDKLLPGSTLAAPKPGLVSFVKLGLLGKPLESSILMSSFWLQLGLSFGFVLRGVLVSSLLLLPFHLTFVSFTSNTNAPAFLADIPILGTLSKLIGVVTERRTSLGDYLIIFGAFLFMLLPWLGLKLHPYLRRYLSNRSLIIGTTLAFAVTVIGWFLDFQLLGPFVILITATIVIVWLEIATRLKPSSDSYLVNENQSSSYTSKSVVTDCFVLTLLVLSLVLGFVPEILYLRDFEDFRLNTLFKTQYQTWVMLSIAAPYAVWWIWTWGSQFYQKSELKPASIPLWLRVWRIFLIPLLCIGFLYAITGPIAKTEGFARSPQIDGSLWLRDVFFFEDDYEAIKWLNMQAAEKLAFRDTILESSSAIDNVNARISTFTGFPALLGWYTRERLWRDTKAPTPPDAINCGEIVAKNKVPVSELWVEAQRGTIARVADKIELRRQATKDKLLEGKKTLQEDEPECRLWLTDLIYRTENATMAEQLLLDAKVRYVYVGKYEITDTESITRRKEYYSYVALTKFAKFMKVIYRNSSVTIYSF